MSFTPEVRFMQFISQRGRWTTLLILIILLVVTACQKNTPQETVLDSSAAPSPTTPDPEEAETTTAPDEPAQETETQVPTDLTPTASPTPAPTLSDWREAPITPEAISDRVLEIYAEGQRQGRDPASFSVIGDCQSIPYVFMGPFGRGELEPDPAESQLWNAINFFEISFDRWAVTARGGFTAASILNSLQADPEECKPGETPLTCEFRINNPAFVLITLETWLDPESINRYEVYLREILDTVIARGAVPILLTKADSSELRDGTHVINPVIVQLAYEYQVPVVNFWRAAQYLDNYGIDPEREGFHLSDAGYKLKNILALRTLYQVWTTVTDDAETGDAADTAPVSTATAETAQAAPPEVTVPDCDAGGCVFFGTAQSQDGAVSAQGVYAYHTETQTLTQILGMSFDLQDVSADGTRLLVNRENYLYEVALSDGSAELITETFYSFGSQGAYWNGDETEVIYLDLADPIETDTGDAFNLFPYAGDALYFESGTCASKDFCQSEGVYRLDSEGDLEKLPVTQPVFSPDGNLTAFLNPSVATAENYYHIWYLLLMETEVGLASQRVLYFPAETGFEVYPEVEGYAFSPDGDQLFILYDVYSEYDECSRRLQTYLWDLDTGILYPFGALEGVSASLQPRFTWSPDGWNILFFLTELTEEGEYITSVYETDLATGEKLTLVAEGILTETDYTYLTNLSWH